MTDLSEIFGKTPGVKRRIVEQTPDHIVVVETYDLKHPNCPVQLIEAWKPTEVRPWEIWRP